jgi:hypothetical protein
MYMRVFLLRTGRRKRKDDSVEHGPSCLGDVSTNGIQQKGRVVPCMTLLKGGGQTSHLLPPLFDHRLQHIGAHYVEYRG